MPMLALGVSQPINWLENNLRLSSDGFEGFDYNTDKDGIWFEGTAQMAEAYQALGMNTKAEKYRNELRRAQAANIEENYNDGKGIISASHNSVTTGFGWSLYKIMGLAPTCWFIFDEIYFNPLN